jgi:hypothetical protein
MNVAYTVHCVDLNLFAENGIHHNIIKTLTWITSGVGASEAYLFKEASQAFDP